MVRDHDESAIPSVYNLAEVPAFRDGPGIRQSVFRGNDHLLGFSIIGPEKPEADPHSHPYEQSNLLIEGRLEFLVDGESVFLEPYDALTIPPGVPHTSRPVDDGRAVLLAFWPLREDRLEATSYQREFYDTAGE